MFLGDESFLRYLLFYYRSIAYLKRDDILAHSVRSEG